MSEKTSFLGKFFGIKVEKAGDDLLSMLASFDPATASEAKIRLIQDDLSRFCLICEEKRQKMIKEEKDVTAIKAAVQKKLALVTKWQSDLANEAVSADEKKMISTKLPDLVAEIEASGPAIDKEVAEFDTAKKLFETYDQVVKSTQEKLKKSLAQKGNAESALELAKAEESLAKDELEAARILAGLKSANEFDVSSVVDKEAEKARVRTEAMKREASLLAGTSTTEDTFITEALAKMESGSGSPKTIEEQLAAIKAKL